MFRGLLTRPEYHGCLDQRKVTAYRLYPTYGMSLSHSQMILHHKVSGLRSEVDVAVGAEAVIIPICLHHFYARVHWSHNKD